MSTIKVTHKKLEYNIQSDIITENLIGRGAYGRIYKSKLNPLIALKVSDASEFDHDFNTFSSSTLIELSCIQILQNSKHIIPHEIDTTLFNIYHSREQILAEFVLPLKLCKTSLYEYKNEKGEKISQLLNDESLIILLSLASIVSIYLKFCVLISKLNRSTTPFSNHSSTKRSHVKRISR